MTDYTEESAALSASATGTVGLVAVSLMTRRTADMMRLNVKDIRCTAVYGRFPGWLLSRMVFPQDRTFRGKTIPGWSFSRMRRFPERVREW